MGDTAVFAIELQDETSGAAEAAAKSLLDLQAQIDAGREALREMQAAMRQLKGSGATEAITELKEQMAAQRAVVAGATADYVKLGGGFGGMSAKALAARAEQEALAAAEAAAAAKAQEEAAALAAVAEAESAAAAGAGELAGATNGAAAGLDGLGGSAGFAGMSEQQLLDTLKGSLGPMGGLFEKAQLLSKGLGGVSVAALAVSVAVVALAAALAAAAVKFIAFAIGAADAARNMRLMLGDAVKSAAGGEALAGAIDRISATVPQTRAELAQMATELAKTGLRGRELEAALEAAAKKAAGPLAGAKLLSLDVQLAKARENVDGLFEGVNVEPLLRGLHEVLSLLSASTATGHGLRAAMKGLLDPLMSALAAAAPIAKALFQGLVIGALQVTVIVLRVKNAIASTFGGASSSVTLLTMALQGAKVLVYVLAAAFAAAGVMMGATMAVVGVAVGIAAGIIRGVVAVVQAIGAAFSWLGGVAAGAWDGIVGALSAAWAAVSGFLGQFTSAGANLVQGLVQGIASGAGAILDALLAPVRGGINAVKSLLGIASPSKVFAGIGKNTAEGFAQGVDAGAGDVTDATASMVSIPSPDAAAAPTPSAKATAAKAGAGARTYNINIYGVANAEQVREPSFLEKLAAAVEEASQSSGAPLEVDGA